MGGGWVGCGPKTPAARGDGGHGHPPPGRCEDPARWARESWRPACRLGAGRRWLPLSAISSTGTVVGCPRRICFSKGAARGRRHPPLPQSPPVRCVCASHLTVVAPAGAARLSHQPATQPPRRRDRRRLRPPPPTWRAITPSRGRLEEEEAGAPRRARRATTAAAATPPARGAARKPPAVGGAFLGQWRARTGRPERGCCCGGRGGGDVGGLAAAVCTGGAPTHALSREKWAEPPGGGRGVAAAPAAAGPISATPPCRRPLRGGVGRW